MARIKSNRTIRTIKGTRIKTSNRTIPGTRTRISRSRQNSPRQGDEQKMTKDDAERLLQALANEEKEVQEKVKKEKAAAMRVKTLKNW
ncbi:MAG: hypothetical protein R2744_01425 [Bacteroidales bacterium]